MLVPLALLLLVSGATYALARWHPARPGVPKSSGSVQLGDQYRGETLFSKNCAGCHGDNGTGGIGPRLAGAALTLQQVKAQIDAGGGSMPAGLVKGQDEKDVLAYVATLLASHN